jgi:hypothetical protein
MLSSRSGPPREHSRKCSEFFSALAPPRRDTRHKTQDTRHKGTRGAGRAGGAWGPGAAARATASTGAGRGAKRTAARATASTGVRRAAAGTAERSCCQHCAQLARCSVSTLQGQTSWTEPRNRARGARFAGAWVVFARQSTTSKP